MILIGLKTVFVLVFALNIVSLSASAKTIRLGVATHFSHGANLGALQEIRSYGANTVRDGISWRLVEKKKGEYVFDHKKIRYIRDLLDKGFDPIIVFMPNGPEFYNNSKTTVSEADITAFANFIVATLNEFPELKRIEIGNEFNGLNEYFISGEALGKNKKERAQYYTNIVKKVYRIVKSKHEDVLILGGATHSIPVGYIEFLKDMGALDHMDGLAFHPYRKTPDILDLQIRYLKSVVGDLPLYATEFGQSFGPERTELVPDYMLKSVALLGSSGVTEAIWYQYRDKNIKSMGLNDLQGNDRPAAAGFKFINEALLPAGNPVRVEALRPTQMFKFGHDYFLIWGQEQRVEFIADNPVFFDATGSEIDRPERISNKPILIKAQELEIKFRDNEILTDSYFDFDLFNNLEAGWSYTIVRPNETVTAANIQGGQQRSGTPWNPYLGIDDRVNLRIDQLGVRTVKGFSVVERYVVSSPTQIRVVGNWKRADSVSEGSPLALTIRLNGEAIYTSKITDRTSVELQEFAVSAQDEITFEVSQAGNGSEYVQRHIKIFGAATIER